MATLPNGPLQCLKCSVIGSVERTADCLMINFALTVVVVVVVGVVVVGLCSIIAHLE